MALWVAVLCIVVTALSQVHPSHAQNSQQDFLNAHNAARAQVNVPDIVWDNAVAAYAQNYANSRIGDCNLVHSNSNGTYGENLAKGSGSFTGVAAVNLWVAEKPNYDYNSNSCVGGQQCLNYTQVIWKNSVKLGCARVQFRVIWKNSVKLGCARVQCTNGWWFVTCNYSPPGNYVGQRPY
ncbi:hypothetical protein FF1_003378 [Malus domestica]|uniref:pathogenesis-related leaf protein 6-like n=1 Tax=Malus sylvestris TaxID=3752 RepID=UPI0021AC1D4C|nr:pathogenesis-related leaf protein 6-like [Malus sylvestris]